ncbi:hypothetical protein [Shewanella sedimentimangrovi]|uniref:Uncharacterized protein n=1 Tax=Shewanella sedimentimangrovi TaxID=2814293 RepID=A0ABX7R242_9GAMM|nr:hypothetical protein [Shewanella sedimentimangrovi]QSX37357.1 hypothetical protein JYB85_00400 [Shewanella sedimentimangrovi]
MAKLMQMALEQIVEREKEALPVNGETRLPLSPPPAAVAAERFQTLFLTGDSNNFASLKPPIRVIVMSEAEAKAAGDKWGDFYPLDIRLFINKAKTKAHIFWSKEWQLEESIEFEKNGADWKFSQGSFNLPVKPPLP